MARHNILPEPELIGRSDETHGRWDVTQCSAERGEPATSITERRMLVPFDDDELARCVRAHEVMHSKVSPGTYWPAWVARKWASERAMRVVEEARVNNLCHRIHIPVRKFLADGGERSTGERVAKLEKWDDAVYALVAMLDTAGYEPFLKGIKKHKPEWVKPLRAIGKKILGELNHVPVSKLGETSTFTYELAPAGFRYTERLASWLDSIAQLEDAENAERMSKVAERKEAPISEEEIEEGQPGGEYRSISGFQAWGQLNVTDGELTATLPGSIGRKRRAAQVGRNPRRIHRMLTDPERRIFDVKTRGKGGIVLIDASGSMQFCEEDIMRIVAAAPGALVAMYAENEDGSSGEPNLHVLARNGKLVKEIPSRQTGNNVDLPALQWAVSQRKSNKTPIIWVSDGEVTSVDGEYYEALALQCLQLCQRERIMTAYDIDAAHSILADLKSGRKPKWSYPNALTRAWNHITGKSIKEATGLRAS